MKLEKLKAEAARATEWRKHTMGDWQDFEDGSGAYALCDSCEMTVTVRTNPAPNQIDIGGRAVALTCPAHVPEAAAREIAEATIDVYWDRGEQMSKKNVARVIRGQITLDALWFEELLPYNQGYLWELEKALVRDTLDAHDATDVTVAEFFESYPDCRPFVNHNLDTLLRHTWIEVGLETTIAAPDMRWDTSLDYDSLSGILEALGLNPEAVGQYIEIEDAPDLPDRTDPAVTPKAFAEAVVNGPYGGPLVALLTNRQLSRLYRQRDAILENGITLKAGTNLVFQNFGVGATSTLMPLQRDLTLAPDQIESIYADGAMRYGIQATCGLVGEAWDGDWDVNEAETEDV